MNFYTDPHLAGEYQAGIKVYEFLLTDDAFDRLKTAHDARD